MITLNTRSRGAARGFTLVEVMVALIIIAVGMLGIAKMQGLALSSTGASRSRALAAIEASSLAAAMQANRTYWSSGSVPASITVTTSAGAAPTIASTTTAMQTALTAVAGTTPCSGMGATLSCYCTTGNSAPCTTSINLAASDVYDWGWALADFLPSATATVTCAPLDLPVDCTITIGWNENAVAMTSQQAANLTGLTVPVSYSLYVVP
jgi:type IV pilus assembly protein PilV